jgi:hypothetical protein
MFFSKVVLFAFFLAALSVLATPHALHHNALHRRVVAARAASFSNSTVSAKRQNSAKCIQRPSSSSASSSIVHAPSPIVAPESTHSPTTSFTPAPVPSPSSTTHQKQPAPSSSTAAPPASSSPSTPGANGPFFGDGTFFASSSISPSFFLPFYSKFSIAGLGACGITNDASNPIVAVSEIRYDAAAYVFLTLSLFAFDYLSSSTALMTIPTTTHFAANKFRSLVCI